MILSIADESLDLKNFDIVAKIPPVMFGRRKEHHKPVQDGPPLELKGNDWIKDGLAPCILAIAELTRGKYLVQHIATNKRSELEGLFDRSASGEVRVTSGRIDGKVAQIYRSANPLRSKEEIRNRYGRY